MYPLSFFVPASLTDRTVTMGQRQLCTLMQDLLTHHLYTLGCDGVRMERESNAIWVFTRASYTIFRRPRWEEAVTARCFAVRKTGCGLYFNMDIHATDGEELVRGRLDAVLLDKDTRRPMRFRGTPVPEDFPVEAEILPADNTPWAPEDAGACEGTFTVHPDDTDMNGHANNIAYLRWVLAAGGRKVMESDRFTLTYLRECMEGETVTAFRYRIAGGTGVELQSGDTPVMRASFYGE